MNTLNLVDLHLMPGMPGLTTAQGESFAESCAVCLDDQKHKTPVELTIGGDRKKKYVVHWTRPTAQMRSTYNDEQRATEDGAYAVAILIVKDLTGYTVLQKSVKGSGFDWWMGPPDGGLFQEKVRLEVSGIRDSSRSKIESRFREKQSQVERGNNSLPVHIVIVGFREPFAKVAIHAAS